MCAINPTYKKRFLLDVYTSDPNMTEEQFIGLALNYGLSIEITLNETSKLRWHIKETEQQAD